MAIVLCNWLKDVVVLRPDLCGPPGVIVRQPQLMRHRPFKKKEPGEEEKKKNKTNQKSEKNKQSNENEIKSKMKDEKKNQGKNRTRSRPRKGITQPQEQD